MASMLLMNVPLTALDLHCETNKLLDTILKGKNDETYDCVAQVTRSVKEQEH